MKKIIIFLLAAVSTFLFSNININNYSPRTGRLIKEDGTTLNMADRMVSDEAGRPHLNTTFGEQIMGHRITTISAQFVYGIDTREVNITETSGGTVTTVNNLLQLNTSTADAGRAVFETKKTLRYISGYEVECYFTAAFSPPKVNSLQRIGLFCTYSGLFIGFESDGNFYFSCRHDGVDTNHEITDVSFEIDYTHLNTYRISFSYLGAGNERLEVLNPAGSWDLIANVSHNGSSDSYVSNAYLPVKVEVQNLGNDTDIYLKTSNYSVGIIDGASPNHDSREFAINAPQSSVSAGTTVLIAFRNKSTFKTKLNKIPARLGTLFIATDLNKVAGLFLKMHPTITNTPTWVDADIENSTIEYSTDLTFDNNTGELRLPITLSKTDNLILDTRAENYLLYPGELSVFYIQSTGLGDINFGMTWEELF